jgi:hypothetical protein
VEPWELMAFQKSLRSSRSRSKPLPWLLSSLHMVVSSTTLPRLRSPHKQLNISKYRCADPDILLSVMRCMYMMPFSGMPSSYCVQRNSTISSSISASERVVSSNPGVSTTATSCRPTRTRTTWQVSVSIEINEQFPLESMNHPYLTSNPILLLPSLLPTC